MEIWSSARHPGRSWYGSVWFFPDPPTRWHQDLPRGKAPNCSPRSFSPSRPCSTSTPTVRLAFFSLHLLLTVPSVNLNSKYLQGDFYMFSQLNVKIKSHARVKLFRSFFPQTHSVEQKMVSGLNALFKEFNAMPDCEQLPNKF